MASQLWDAFNRRLAEKARPPGDVADLTKQAGWSTRDLARELNVSERTARRYRQTGHIPERRREQFGRAAREVAGRRARERIGRRGLSGLTVQGRYRVSKSVYETHPDSPARILPGNAIPGSVMRDVFDAADRGDVDGANEQLEQALSEAYGASNPLQWERVDDLDYRVR